MKIGTVLRPVQVTKTAQCLTEQRFLAVRTVGGEVVAADGVGAQPGDRVLLVVEPAAARYSMQAPVDAVVVAVLEP